MEPWSAPRCRVHDGSVIGRTGPERPAPGPYWVTETAGGAGQRGGVLDIDPRPSAQGPPGTRRMFRRPRGRHGSSGRRDQGQLRGGAPYAEWWLRGLIQLATCPEREREAFTPLPLVAGSRRTGTPKKRSRCWLAPMAMTGAEPIGRWQRRAAARSLATPGAVRLLPALSPVTNPRWTRSGRSWSPRAGPVGADPTCWSARPTPATGSCCRSRAGQRRAARSCTSDDDGSQPDYQSSRSGASQGRGGGAAAGAAARGDLPEWPRPSRTAPGLSCCPPGVDAEHAAIRRCCSRGAVHPGWSGEDAPQVGMIVEAADAREVHHIALLIATAAAAD